MSGSQKFIARNRAPRVQIEYDVELYGAQKKVQLPFVMGVMSDLSGKAEKPSVDQRDFLEIDVDNFDDRLKAMAPKAQFSVPNTLTGDGNLSVDLTFEKMSDFGPEAIAEKTGALKPLLDARRQLTDLMAYMDGKSGAETLIENMLTNPALLQALTATPGEATAELDSALESLKAAMPVAQEKNDNSTQDTLAALAASSPKDTRIETSMDDVFGGLELPDQEDVVDETEAALDALKAAPVALDVEQDAAADVLAGLAEAAPLDEPVRDGTAEVLSNLDRVEDVAEVDTTSDVLSGIERAEPTEETDTTADVLNSIETVAADIEDTSVDDALASIEAAPEPTSEVDQTDDVLSSLEPFGEIALDGPDADDILATIDTNIREQDVSDTTSDVLASIDTTASEPDVKDKTDDVLAAIDAVAVTTEDGDDINDVLSSIDTATPDAPSEDTSAEDILGTLEPVVEDSAEDTADTSATDILKGLEPVPEDAEEDVVSDVLSGIDTTIPEAEDRDLADDILANVEAVEAEDVTSNAVEDALSSIDLSAPEVEPDDKTDDILASVDSVEDAVADTTQDDVLSGIELSAPEPDASDNTDDILDGIDAMSAESVPEDDLDDVLASSDEVDSPVVKDTAIEDALASLDTDVADTQSDDITDDVLAGIDSTAEADPQENEESLDDILSSLETDTLGVAEDDAADDILNALEDTSLSVDAESDDLDALLAGIDTDVGEVENDTSTDDILGSLDATPETAETPDDLDDILGALEEAVEEGPAEASAVDVLGGLGAALEVEDSDDDLDALLAGIETDVAAAPVEENTLDSILGDLEAPQGQETVAGAGTDGVLAGLDAVSDSEEEADDLDDLLASLDPVALADEGDDTDDILNALDTDGDEPQSDDEDLDALLADLGDESTATVGDESDDDLDALLADLDTVEDDPAEAKAEIDPLDDLLADLDTEADAQSAGDLDAPDDDLDALLADLETPQELAATTDDADDGLDALLAELDGDDADAEPQAAADEDDLDALLAGLEADTSDETVAEGDADDDLDALLAGLEAEDPPSDDAGDDDLDALLDGLSDDVPAAAVDDDLDSLLDELEGDDAAEISTAKETPVSEGPKQSPFGLISAPRPARDALNRGKFRMAVFGDFTGRAARGAMDTGDALAARTPIELDVDTIDDVIEGFATTLTLPIGKDGAGIEISLKEMDDLHPDELYEKVEIFEAISGLHQQLSVGSMAAKATEQLQSWSEEFGTPIKIPKRSASTSVPANLKLSDFQALIGDTSGSLTKATPADELIAQIVGPHIVKAPDAGAEAMKTAVDEALSSAMRMVLHHPDFQAVESQWRSLDMLARRVETDSDLQVVLYDVSAEEIAADLAAHEDLGQSGLFKLLTQVLDPEEGAGGFSALFGLYTFEETPTHAELLARIGQLGAHVDAPFFAGISPGYLEVAKEDRHPLTAKAWDTLREMPEAAYLGLGAPRFLIRQPYGAKSEPIYEFEFEEFTPQEGLSGMLWANPAILTAILLAGTYKKDGKAMNLGSMMSLGDMPFYYVNDRYGDQVALPCTERNLTSDPVQTTLGRGFMPVVWVKGRNEVRLASFRALGGDEIAGPWSGEAPPARAPGSAPSADIEMNLEIEDQQDSDDAEESLDDLLAGFEDDDSDDDLDSDIDPDLAALLEGL